MSDDGASPVQPGPGAGARQRGNKGEIDRGLGRCAVTPTSVFRDPSGQLLTPAADIGVVETNSR